MPLGVIFAPRSHHYCPISFHYLSSSIFLFVYSILLVRRFSCACVIFCSLCVSLTLTHSPLLSQRVFKCPLVSQGHFWIILETCEQFCAHHACIISILPSSGSLCCHCWMPNWLLSPDRAHESSGSVDVQTPSCLLYRLKHLFIWCIWLYYLAGPWL